MNPAAKTVDPLSHAAALSQSARIREYKRFAEALTTVTNIASLTGLIAEHALALRDIDVKAKKEAIGEVVARKPVAGAAKGKLKAAKATGVFAKKKPAAKAKPTKKAAKKPAAAPVAPEAATAVSG
jgi:hypothetical protein